jgi:ubiquinone biosynthesis protein UbiJ
VQATAPALRLANRVLERENWARERLSAHSGRTVRLVCGPATSTMSIAPSGMLDPGYHEPDLTLEISPLRVPALLAHPERWTELVAASGDASLAATFADLAQTLPWFVEQAFASLLGPLLGTRVADAGRALLALPEHAAQSFGGSLTSYARDEAGIGVGASEVAGFSAEVAAIAARVDALAQRLDQAVEAGSAKAATRGRER